MLSRDDLARHLYGAYLEAAATAAVRAGRDYHEVAWNQLDPAERQAWLEVAEAAADTLSAYGDVP